MTVFWYEVLLIGTIGVAVMALLLLGLFYMAGRRGSTLGTLGSASAALTVFGVSALVLLYDAPGLFVAGVGAPAPIEITRLTYLPETLPAGGVRVDTDNGVYIVEPRALLPQTGTVYRVVRKRYWGDREMEFICLSRTAARCWSVTAKSAPRVPSRAVIASRMVQQAGRVTVWDESTAGLGLVAMFFLSAMLFVVLLAYVVADCGSRDAGPDTTPPNATSN